MGERDEAVLLLAQKLDETMERLDPPTSDEPDPPWFELEASSTPAWRRYWSSGGHILAA